jgi:hypothetical protein
MKAIQLPIIAFTLSALLVVCGSIHDSHARADSYQRLSDEDISKPIDRVDFENDLMPVFTKFGCNAGACHGAAVGRGGFMLSLFGGNPQADYEAIVRQLAGRRINLMRPEESLVILKPTAQMSHGGRQVLDENEQGAQLLLNWIQQGGGYDKQRNLARVEISPRKQVAELDERIQLRAVAHFSDGTTQDVTRWTVFSPEDASAVEVEKNTAVSKVLRRGRHIVIARYLDKVVPIEFIVPLTDSVEATESVTLRSNFIDDEILKLLSTLRLPVSPPVDDATFLRRATLDLTGRLPSANPVKAFLDDNHPKKRETLVDALLASDEFNEYWTLQFGKVATDWLATGGQARCADVSPVAFTTDQFWGGLRPVGPFGDLGYGRFTPDRSSEFLPHRQWSTRTSGVHE